MLQTIMRWLMPYELRLDFREIDMVELTSCMEEVARLKLSGKGRPVWLKENTPKVRRLIVKPILVEKSPEDCLRCCVIVILEDGQIVQFLVDFLPRRFRSLRRLSWSEVARLADRQSNRLPLVPFDPDQVHPW